MTTDLSVWQESNAPMAMLVEAAGIVTAPFTSGVIKHVALVRTGKSAAMTNATSQPNKVVHDFVVRRTAGIIKLVVEHLGIFAEDGMRSERDNAHSV